MWVPGLRSSQAPRGHLSRHRSSRTLNSQATHLKPWDGFISGFIANHKNPGAWLAQVQPLRGPFPTSHHMDVRRPGRVPVKPQSPRHRPALLKFRGKLVAGNLITPASAAVPHCREMCGLVTELAGKDNHSELQVDKATCAGAAGTWGPPAGISEEGGSLGRLVVKLPPYTCNWHLSTDSV